MGFILFICWSFSNLIANSDGVAMYLRISFVAYGFLLLIKDSFSFKGRLKVLLGHHDIQSSSLIG